MKEAKGVRTRIVDAGLARRWACGRSISSDLPEERQDGAGEEDKQLSAEGDEYTTLLKEGFALHRAFLNIKTARLRRAIVALAVEYAKNEIVN